MKEFERVVLLVDLPNARLSAGDVGTIVHIYKNNVAYEVEFFALDGETVAVETLEANQIRNIKKHEMTHSRTLMA